MQRINLVKEETRVGSPRDISSLFSRYAKKEVEHFLVATLDGSHHVIKTYLVTKGLVNRTIVHPREVFRFAIKDNACAIIVSHNHPSGMLQPSPEDLEITRRLSEAGDIIGITLLDHVIISRKGSYSLMEHGDYAPSRKE